jgi:phosphate-selective porin OprO/OprP
MTPPAPLHPFHIDGTGLGAWQLAARIGGIDMDKTAFTKNFATAGSAQNATTWGVGVNWYVNKNLKWMMEYEQTSFGMMPGVKPAKGSLEAEDERVLMGRLQFAF